MIDIEYTLKSSLKFFFNGFYSADEISGYEQPPGFHHNFYNSSKNARVHWKFWRTERYK